MLVTAIAVCAHQQVTDVTVFSAFEEHITNRNDVWVVLFLHASQPSRPWTTSAEKLKDIIRFAYVDCTRLSTDSAAVGHAAAPCVRAGKKSSGKFGYILGYSFGSLGEREIPPEAFTGAFESSQIHKWATTISPKLAVQLTAHAGTNVFHKEYLSTFLQRPRMAKALIFSTSPQGNAPPLLQALAVHFRYRLLVGEVKASDMSLRKAFAVNFPPAMVIVDDAGKRHIYKGDFTKPAMAAYMEEFAALRPDIGLHAAPATTHEKIKVKKQAYSNAEQPSSFPKGFDPWRVLGLRRSLQPPKAKVK